MAFFCPCHFAHWHMAQMKATLGTMALNILFWWRLTDHIPASPWPTLTNSGSYHCPQCTA